MTMETPPHRRFVDESGAHNTSTLDVVPSVEEADESAQFCDESDAPGLFCNHHVATPTDVPPHVWRIHGRDYDLTSFVDEHPGGDEVLLDEAGK